jgi:hypothetical protein
MALGRGSTNGTKAIVWSCNGQANQQWNVNSNGTITGVQSGMCLDVTGASTAKRRLGRTLVVQRRQQPALDPRIAGSRRGPRSGMERKHAPID